MCGSPLQQQMGLELCDFMLILKLLRLRRHGWEVCLDCDGLLPKRLTDGCLCCCCRGNRLFETHPECKDVFFLFRDVEDLERLRTNRELRAHGLRSVRGTNNTFSRMNE